MSIDAMKLALEALELLARYENPETKIQVRKPRDGGPIVTMYPHKVASEAAAALRAAIEEQETVTYDTGGFELEARFYSAAELREMIKALDEMNASARRMMEEI